jgi:hypothetical protein
MYLLSCPFVFAIEDARGKCAQTEFANPQDQRNRVLY